MQKTEPAVRHGQPAAYVEECWLGRVVGPLSKGSHVSRFGVIPKSSQWRLIVNLSHPEGGVCVRKRRYSGRPMLISVENAIDVIIDLGKGSLLYLESAYRNVPVHPTDQSLVWEDSLYIDTVLPFGLRSAPKSFTAFADGLMDDGSP